MTDDEITRLERRLQAARDAGALDEVPSDVLQRAQRLFRLHRPQPEAPLVRLARLLFDSFHGPTQPAFARGSADGEPREQVYTVDDLSLRLWQEPAADATWYLIGQITDATENPFVALQATLESETAHYEGQIEGQGEMHFAAVASGRYLLRIAFPDAPAILVPAVPVGGA